jgi:hypothetical protein
MAAAWYIESGEIRDFLRHIFPDLQDFLKVLLYILYTLIYIKFNYKVHYIPLMF